MIIRLGYVAMTLNLHECSPSKTVTVATLRKIESEEGRLNRLTRVTRENLGNTLRILRYNAALGIKVYRLTSKLVPLATLPELSEWDYAAEFADEFKEIGSFIKENELRISAHPDHFTIINSPQEKVVEDAIRDLEYHYRIFEAMGLQDFKYKFVLHVGGLYKNREESILRFKENFKRVNEAIGNRIILENDDKVYSAREVLEICRELKIPMVLDVHHHACNSGGNDLSELLADIFDTWRGEQLPPKVHFSSPKSGKDYRSHADDIDCGEFLKFMKQARTLNRDFDVMLEAKNKDNALFKLMTELGSRDGIKIIDKASFEVL